MPRDPRRRGAHCAARKTGPAASRRDPVPEALERCSGQGSASCAAPTRSRVRALSLLYLLEERRHVVRWLEIASKMTKLR